MVLLFAFLGCASEPWCHSSGTHLHTSWNARWQASQCSEGGARLTKSMVEMEESLSVWNPASELVGLQHSHEAVEVSERIYGVTGAALDMAAASQGAFDPTIEPLMRAWGFYGDGEPSQPSPAVLAEVLHQIGYDEVDRFREEGRPMLHLRHRQLDLSAILEGYAADQLSDQLSGLGVSDSMVQVGDEVRVQGTGPHGLWTLGVPGSEMVLQLTNKGMASSGAVRSTPRSTLDPRTGLVATSDALHITIVAATAEEADGLATSIAVMGVEAGVKLLEARPDVAALIVVEGEEEPVLVGEMARYILR